MKYKYCLIILTLFVLSCKKQESVKNIDIKNDTIIAPNFTYEGSFTVFEEMQFHIENIPSGSTTLEWKFGDGTTSTELNPKHQFASRGNYNITLIVGADSLYEISKNFTINVNAQRFASQRHWEYKEMVVGYPYWRVTRTVQDTVVSLVNENDSCLRFGSSTTNLEFTTIPRFTDTQYLAFFPYSNPVSHIYLKYVKSMGIFEYSTIDPIDSQKFHYFTEIK